MHGATVKIFTAHFTLRSHYKDQPVNPMQEVHLFILPIIKKSTNTFCWQNSNFYNVKTSVHISYQCA
jgi:hypothetical protein